MRWLLLFGLVCLPVLAAAKPKVAVAPLAGDSDDKVADVIAEVASKDAKVTGPEETEQAIAKIGASAEDLDGKAIKKLRKRLGVDAVIHGKVEKDGSRKTVELEVSVRGKKTERFSLTFKNARSEKFKDELREELSTRISEGEGADDDDGDERAKEPPRRRMDDDDDRSRRKKKKRRDDDDDEPARRHPVTHAAVRVAAGGAITRRTLTYDTSSPMPPRRVGTASGSVRLEGELYPGSFDTLTGFAANVGVFFEVDKTLGLAIRVPGTSTDASIDKLHVLAGARYRIPFGSSSLALGVSYYRRRYIADRDLGGAVLDMPDVDYQAVAPGAVGRFAASPKLGVFFALDVPLMLSAGPIQEGLSYGPAKIIAFELDAGIEYEVSPHYAIKAAIELSNLGLTFDAKMGTQAQTRMVSGATDRNLGFTVALEVLY